MSKKNEVVTVDQSILATASKKQIADFAKFDKRIVQAYGQYQGAMAKVAGSLAAIEHSKAYIGGGYANTAAYAYDKYGIVKSTVSECINTWERFGDMETGLIKEEWKDYNFSQLKLMRKLTDEELAKVQPSFTTRALEQIIRDRKAALEAKEEENIVDAEVTEISEEVENTEESTNFDKVENSGETRPYAEVEFTMDEVSAMSAEELKNLILKAFEIEADMHFILK